MKINMSNINVGIDLGGSHVAIGVVNNEGKILEQFEKDYTVKEKENVLPDCNKIYCRHTNGIKAKI